MRPLVRILAIFVVLVLLAAGIFLIPAHLQVRGVEPPLPDEDQLRALMAVENGPIGIRYVITSSQEVAEGKLAHSLFLLEWADGTLFMIDAGMDRATAAEFAELMQTLNNAGEAVTRGTVAELLGEDVRRVGGVGFTHLHIDHSQGVVPFCEARGPGAKVFQTGWQAELHNINTEEGAEIVAQSCLEPGELVGEGILTAEGFPGLGIIGVGGHTPGSTLFAVGVGDRLWLFSGDTTNSKANLLSNTGKGFLYSYLLVPENTARTQALRLWLTALDAKDDIRVVVSHDLGDIETSGLAEY